MWRIMHLLLLACALVVLMASCDREEDDQPGATQDPGLGSLRLAFLPLNNAAPTTLFLDDTVQVADLAGPWVGTRRTLRGGNHHATLTVQADEPTEVFDQLLTLPAGGEYTYVVTGLGNSWGGYLIADSCLRDTTHADPYREATIRLVNVHACDTVVITAEYMRLYYYNGVAVSGGASAYGTIPPGGADHPTYTISLTLWPPRQWGGWYDADSVEAGGVYSFYAFGVDPDLDPDRAFRMLLVTDYPPLP